jgi:hypothetical protein
MQASQNLNNALNNFTWEKIASNNLVVKQNNFLTLQNGVIYLSSPGGRIEGTSIQRETFASDNETLGKKTIVYIPNIQFQTYNMPVSGGVLTNSAVGSYINHVADQSAVDFATLNLTVGQFRIEKVLENGAYCIVSINNAISTGPQGPIGATGLTG